MARKLGIDDRVETMPKSEAYHTYKDHKADFQNKQSVRLINQNKSNLGKVSKKMLEDINSEIRVKVKYNQWTNTGAVLEWFKNIENKNRSTFIKFDIDNYYPSINAELLDRSINWAKSLVQISEEQKEVILSTKRTLLYSGGQPWTKKSDEGCDVTIGSYDGAEVCELVGLYMLSQLQQLNVNIGLYRDDGLGVTTQRPQQVENTKKKICKIFKDNGLKISVEANKHIVDFLDVTMDLQKNTYQPFMKPNSPLLYVNNESNHPPSILRNIPKSIN